MMITTVIFDVANVIVDWDAARALAGSVTEKQLTDFLESEVFWELNARTDAGMLLVDAQAELEEDEPELAQVYRVYLANFAKTVSGPVPGTAGVIEALLARDVPCFGLSNWAAENFNVARRANPVIDQLVDVIVSGEVGLAKPDPAIFRFALRRFGLDPASTVMVDDTQTNLDAAASVGLSTILFTDADALREDLGRLGLL